MGDGEQESLYINQIALTALDLSNETHDTHHPGKWNWLLSREIC